MRVEEQRHLGEDVLRLGGKGIDEVGEVRGALHEVQIGGDARLAQKRYDDLSTKVFLRAADAMHLSCAAENGFDEIFTNDRHMLAACAAFGLDGRNLMA